MPAPLRCYMALKLSCNHLAPEIESFHNRRYIRYLPNPPGPKSAAPGNVSTACVTPVPVSYVSIELISAHAVGAVVDGVT